MTTLTQSPSSTPVLVPELPTPTTRPRAALIAAALVVGSLVSMALTIWHPEPDANDVFSYETIAPIRDAWWAWHVFGGIAIMMGAVALSFAICLLVRTRGSACANVGAALTSLGAMAFGVGIAAEGVLFASITDPSVMPVDTGTQAMEYLSDNPGRYLAVPFPGIVMLTIGVLLLAVGLGRSRSVPRWVPITLAVTNVASFAVPFGIVGVLISGVTTVSLLAVAWYLWQQAR